MSPPSRPLVDDYAEALRDYLDSGSEEALRRAYDLGRRALSESVGLLEIVAMHGEAADLASAGRPGVATPVAGNRAERRFLAEVLSPFEIVHRGVRESYEALRQVNESLEGQSRRIAQALHDDAGPLLVRVHMALHAVATKASPSDLAQIKAMREGLTELEERLRHLSHELRPRILEDRGLVPALRFLAAGVSMRTGIPVRVECNDVDRLPSSIETTVYRIVQEALVNVGRHARATVATVRVSRDGSVLRCSVRDDGVGIGALDSASPATGDGLGLVGIRERLDAVRGTVEIVSPPEGGTHLHVTIPVEG